MDTYNSIGQWQCLEPAVQRKLNKSIFLLTYWSNDKNNNLRLLKNYFVEGEIPRVRNIDLGVPVTTESYRLIIHTGVVAFL